jgi:hypothetical protein
MSPVSRSRKTKRSPQSRAQHAPPSPFAPILADAAELAAETDPLVAELWAAHLLGTLFSAAWEQADEDSDPDELFGLELKALIDYLVRHRRPGALAALRSLGAVGEAWTREEAIEAAEQLAEHGVKEPAWLANAPEPVLVGVSGAEDELGDREAISLIFTRGTKQHVLTALIMHGREPDLVSLVLSTVPIDDAVRTFIADPGAVPSAAALTPAEARVRLEDALEAQLCGEPLDLFEDDDPNAEFSDPNLLWPLLAVRLELLPLDTVSESAQSTDLDDAVQVALAVEAFLASPRGAGLPDQEFARALTMVLADEAIAAERGPYGFGPLALAARLDGETFEHLSLTDAQLEQFGPTLSAWAHFTADARELSAAAHQAWDEQLPELVELFRAAYLDPDMVTHRAECPEVVPIDHYEPGKYAVDENSLVESLTRMLAGDGGSDGESVDEAGGIADADADVTAGLDADEG